ncbi:hypothetical protein QE152_g12551 [Popillia japonica]|uniref:Uncharacterized protein n=1 Tax=Popillia japonica TaxID=7064 RepID=A0AAW1LIQ3_POPJA
MAASYLTNAPRLKGRENFDEWSFAIENFMILEGLKGCIEGRVCRDVTVLEDLESDKELQVEISSGIFNCNEIPVLLDPVGATEEEIHEEEMHEEEIHEEDINDDDYIPRCSWEATENRNTCGDIKKRQLCRKSCPYTNAMKGIEEVDDLTKLHEKSDKTSEEELKKLMT